MLRKSVPYFVLFFLAIVASVVVVSHFYPDIYSNAIINPIQSRANSPDIHRVIYVYDGDTIEIETGEKIRYIGINTPELHTPNSNKECYGEEAADKNRDLVEGRWIRLVKETSNSDKYGRLLRYVYLIDPLSKEELFVNEYLIKEGYAKLMMIAPDTKYSLHFFDLQNSAKGEKRGLWGACT